MTNSTRTTPRIILASGSPRRRDLLARLGLPLTVISSGIDETLDGSRPIAEAVTRLALNKAEAVAHDLDHGLVIGADTVVVCDNTILGKPIDAADACRMLRLLRGRGHQVVTGVVVVAAAGGDIEWSAVTSDVVMRRYSDREIEAYIATGEPFDKAGSYAVQGVGGGLVAAVNGCFTNVVGLPLCELGALLRRLGIEPATAEPVCTLPSGAPCPRLRQ